VRKFQKYVRDSYKTGIFYNIIIWLITVDKGKKYRHNTYIARQAATAAAAELLSQSKRQRGRIQPIGR